MENYNARLIKSLMDKGAIKSRSVLKAFEETDRVNFVPPKYAKHAYDDRPLPTMEGQTISQPYTVAVMTEALRAGKGMKILEIGTGSGYQAAILSNIVGATGKIITVERIAKLAGFARDNLLRHGVKNVAVMEGDGTLGHKEGAPYDRIIVTASSPQVPPALMEQLATGGRMVIPVGHDLILMEKDKLGKISTTSLGKYVFVPLIGKHGHDDVF